MARSAESRKLLAEFESQLAAASRRHGRTVAFTPAEAAAVGMICDQIDRKSQLKRMYCKAESVKDKIKLSAEVRLLEASIGRMLRGVKVDMPEAPSARSVKARKAANARWALEA